MRSPVALLVLILAACSNPASAPTAIDSASLGPSLRPSPSATPGESPESIACNAPRSQQSPPTGASITATIALGCEGGAVAVAGESVWVVPHLDRVVLQIDPATNKVIGRTPLGDRGPGAEITATDDMVWASVSSPSYDLERLARIDPESGSVVAWVDAAAGFPVIAAGFVWAGGPDGLHRIDPGTNTVKAVIEVGECGVVALADRVLCIGPEVVVTLDPQSDIAMPIAGAPTLGWPVQTAGGLVWGINDASLWAFDADTEKVIVELERPAGVATWGLDAVVLDGSLWVAANSRPGDPRRTAPDMLVRIDPLKKVVDCVVATPDREYGMTAGFGSIWFSVVRQPWLVRFEPAC
jgi:hypothetical protein